MMRRLLPIAGLGLGLAVFLLSGAGYTPAKAAGASSDTNVVDRGIGFHRHGLLVFDTLVANPRPFTGTDGAIRKIDAAGLPWMIRSAHGELDTNGRLTVDVRGLVISKDATVPAQLRGTNPVPRFVSVVSCLTTQSGTVVTSNRIAGVGLATSTGNAHINGTVPLPRPCLAPIILITAGPGTFWFASTGGN